MQKLFLAYFGLWSVIQSNRTRFIFKVNYECDVIFAIPQICAYFVDNSHNLEIDSFKMAVSEHILSYFKNSNSFFFCVHMIMRGTRCAELSWLVVYFRFRQVYIPHMLSSDMCIHSHFKIKSSSHVVRNIIPSNNGLGV